MTRKSNFSSPSTCFPSKCRTTVSPCGPVNEVLLASIDWRLTWSWCPEISTIDRDDLSFNKLSLLLEEWERVFLRNLADALPKVCPDWATRLRLLLELELLISPCFYYFIKCYCIKINLTYLKNPSVVGFQGTEEHICLIFEMIGKTPIRLRKKSTETLF